ncbi:MAG: acylneuraminate cytidylyltransferase family protein [Candidatus Omnitrophica bacterium]|nr:acylneuraminate cytidylyltransferase family protein [Candidatus Omnitrophota bacterium]
MNILCVIPARGGSKGLKNKNVMSLCGRPVISYTIEAALESKLINKIVVSTEDKKIARVSSRYKVQIIKRPGKYSVDSAPIEMALRHAVSYIKDKAGYNADIVVWLQANMPVRKKGQIDKVIRKLISTGADSAVTVRCVDQYPQWMKTMDKEGFLLPFMPKIKAYRRQDLTPMFLLDGAIVAMRRNVLMDTTGKHGVHVFMGKKIVGVIEDTKYATELHDKDDVNLARFYLSEKNGR